MHRSHTELAVHTMPVASSQTGVIVLSMDCCILHIDDEAERVERLLCKATRRLSDHIATAPLSNPLMDLFHDVLANLEKHIAAQDWNQFEIIRLAHSPDGTVLLGGFGIPDQARCQQSRVVLTLHHRSGPSPL